MLWLRDKILWRCQKQRLEVWHGGHLHFERVIGSCFVVCPLPGAWSGSPPLEVMWFVVSSPGSCSLAAVCLTQKREMCWHLRSLETLLDKQWHDGDRLWSSRVPADPTRRWNEPEWSGVLFWRGPVRPGGVYEDWVCVCVCVCHPVVVGRREYGSMCDDGSAVERPYVCVPSQR